MWCLRARPSGWPFRRGWLAQQAPPTFAAFRPPLQHREWPIVAGLSAKHTGGVPAGATVFPTSRYPFCPAQYLRHLAEPLAEAAAACKMARRHAVRPHVGDGLRHASRTAPRPAGGWPVTGLVPRPRGPQEARTAPASQRQGPRACPTAPAKAGRPGGWRAWRPPSASSPWPVAVSPCWPRPMTRAWRNGSAVSGRLCPILCSPPRHANQGAPGSATSLPSEHPRRPQRCGERRWPRNGAALATRGGPSPMARQPSRRCGCLSTRAAGALGLVGATAMTCRAGRGPPTHAKAACAIRGAACGGPRAPRALRNARGNAKAPGHACRGPSQRRRDSLRCATLHRRTGLKHGNALRRSATGSACRADH